MPGSIVDKLLGNQEDLDKETAKIREVVKSDEPIRAKTKIWEVGLVFLLALVPRLLYVFIFSQPDLPGWYTDVFHHWQIAYLSKEIGFHQGFLRLWDFKGMEFFWGLLHPLVLSILFWLTGSISILIPRLLSVFGGSLSIAFLYVLINRYFNKKTAIAVCLFAVFFPITLFSNSVGMQEELGMPLILGSFILFPSYPAISGILLALASMVRAEYWIFSFGLILAALLLKKHLDKAIVMFVSYLAVIIFYMKYLVSWTGSYIFPIRLNFLASVKGDWFEDLPVVGEKLLAKRISQGIFSFGILGAIITFIKRTKHALLFLFGFGNIIFIGFMVGFGAYVKGYITRFWVDRLYNWPYLFFAILIIITFFYWIPEKFKKLRIVFETFAWIFLIFGIVLSQLLWKPINFFAGPFRVIYYSEKNQAEEIADAYQGGGILLPEDRPYLTYFLAHDFKIEGKKMTGQMFDPFFYFPDKENPFADWGEDREKVLNWLKDSDIKLIILTASKPTYSGLIEREGKYFQLVPSDNILIYRVKF